MRAPKVYITSYHPCPVIYMNRKEAQKEVSQTVLQEPQQQTCSEINPILFLFVFFNVLLI